MELEFIEAGKFIRQKRKSAGFKTQRALIQALLQEDPEVSCSEPYISLIEKGAKTPSVHLLDVMARVLKMTPQEKGELLLTYRRVPSDFEFTVRENLKESLRRTTLDELQARYRKDPSTAHFNSLLRALILEDRREEAQALLKQAPSSGDSFLDLQIRTAHMAGLAGNFDFALQGFSLALENCPEDYRQTRGELLMNLGIMHFSKALGQQYSQPLDSLEAFLLAHDFLRQSLEQVPDKLFALDELARCLYHLGEGLQFISQTPQELSNSHPQLQSLLQAALSKNKLAAQHPLLESLSLDYFRQARDVYAQILSTAPGGELPEKPLKEAVYFHAYSHGKMKLLSEASVLMNSITLLDRNWLTCFMQAGLAQMHFEQTGSDEDLERALHWLEMALDYDADSVRWLIRQEKDRELKNLWEHKTNELEKLLA
ncbi:hypothetical protein COW36_20795 [bacterium (Candidatus Blackallbacteria) CG17_big_fil_post_rev_8_21_14_2_50_48_46]|uniref:HTH cro/C1-type domain-containing protein n=1 Tax=bacterium (Candidatus Blackallbacteria) CG17_big_fil_post_rev_8_21_14_2_50_48_46 TaxID=2014261 RepID=A0A2M7FYN2_9BACT|nr:MAG: hypothetical protein COW64_14105 [bacterium (Candidatus Blackallbacteria) CG18_big_fil_WC_8_21_14_2_50_49_26]PIW14481.1 MAG: hypothetical protein COW36_20795 [bacterium (Candidatus Blackallbacteria) CG17_big_fil_post_rev_8_21_14_2_50_48_46]PIW47167.1 MAG: hypothetical protein COW20_13240 [bacterium (Candidatus Blackallbacteria) CG13_big_fil_rev_8_21_14_2_50_49_14]